MEQNPQKITCKALSAYLTGELPSMKQTNGRHHGNHYQLKTIHKCQNLCRYCRGQRNKSCCKQHLFTRNEFNTCRYWPGVKIANPASEILDSTQTCLSNIHHPQRIISAFNICRYCSGVRAKSYFKDSGFRAKPAFSNISQPLNLPPHLTPAAPEAKSCFKNQG